MKIDPTTGFPLVAPNMFWEVRECDGEYGDYFRVSLMERSWTGASRRLEHSAYSPDAWDNDHETHLRAAAEGVLARYERRIGRKSYAGDYPPNKLGGK